MIILILFNQVSVAHLSVSEIMLQSGLTLADTTKSLKPLVDIRVLETVDGKSLSQSSEIQVNTSFTR